MDELLTDFRCPRPDEESWPVMPGPGFIFGCSSDTMDECLGRGLFGLPAHMKASASSIVPGSTIFLFNVTDRLLFGIFEARTPAIMNMEPTAFSKNPKATSSPFPVQIRIRVSLECPPLEDTDPILSDILRSRGSGRIGPLTFAQTEAIATMLASQCGALQYMTEYRRGAKDGIGVIAPPIALPPRSIPK
uniref:DCD domain-containing protein n=1 Tax=Craspedostauros australis TaxID=1486917 RepID=A0A7R9ZN23_9STRA